MNVLQVLTQSRFPVELLSAEITRQRIFPVVIKHVSLQLSVLDEFLPADFTFVVLSSGVRPDVSVQRFLSCESIFTHRTTVRPFTCVNPSEKHQGCS